MQAAEHRRAASRRIISIFTRVVAASLAASCAGTVLAQEATLRAASFLPINATFGELFGRFMAEVNAKGKGVLQIRLVGGPDAVPPFEQGNAVRTGVLDVAYVPPAFYVSIMPEADTQILSTISVLEQRKTGVFDALNKAHNQRMNAVLLAAVGDGVEFHVWTNRSISAAGDLKSMKLRTTPNYTPFFNTLGATLVTTPPGEVQTALERGVVEGYGWPLVGIFDFGWDKYTKFRIDPGFYTVIVNVLVNQDRWKTLNNAQRGVLTRAAEWLQNENVKWVAAKNTAERKRQEEAGIKPIDLGAAFRKQAYDAYWAEITKRAPEQAKALRPLVDK